MAINLLKLFCDVSSKKLVKSPFDSSSYTLPSFFNGDKIPVEMQLLLPNDRGGLSSQYKPITEAVNVELGLVDVAQSPTERAAVTMDIKYKMWSAEIISGGTNWNVGDTATVTTTTSVNPATVKITGATGGVVNAVEILDEGIITTTGAHPATGVTTTKLVYANASATGLTLRIEWATIHTGYLDLSVSAFNTYMGSDLSKETSFEARAYNIAGGTAYEETVFQTTATVKADGFK